MANTLQEANALIERLYPDNMTGEISPADGRAVTMGLAQFTDNVNTRLTGTTDVATTTKDMFDALVGRYNTLVGENGRLDMIQATASGADARSIQNASDIETLKMGDGSGSQTEEEIEAANAARLLNTNFRLAQDPLNMTFRSELDQLRTDVNPLSGSISGALDRANAAFTRADNAFTMAETAISNDSTTRSALSTLEVEKVDVNAAAIMTIESQIGLQGAVGEPGTGIRGDVKANAAAIAVNAGQIAELREGGSGSAADFLTAHGTTIGFTPGTEYRGTGDQAFFDANKATIPGLIQNRATGEFTIPAISLTADDGSAIPAGTPVNLSNAYLNPGLTGRTVGFNPLFYYVIEQGTNRLVGQGNVGSAGTDQEIARDWAVADSVDNITVLGTNLAVTGASPAADIIVRWIAIYNGEDATLVPRLSPFTISFTGRYEPLVEHIVHNALDGEIAALKNEDNILEGGIAANAVGVARTEGKADSNTVLINGVRTRLALPQYQAVEDSTVVPVDTVTVDPTPLNNTLGGGSALAKQVDGAIDTATKFTTRFTDASQVLYLGDGQIARVVNGQFTTYELIEAQDARTDTSPTRYITTPQGDGSRNQPAVLEFGVDVPGQVARAAADTELFLDTGIPTAGPNETINNVSMAFAVRTNGNWNGIPQTLQFDIRRGEVRTLPVPGVTQVTFRATGLADGRIHCEAVHNLGVGNSQDIVTNGGAIRFDAGYTISTAVARVPRGQRTITVGPFTGTEVITVDTIRAGDSDTLTAMVILNDRTLNTGYFLNDADRVNFVTRNNMHDFRFFSTEPGVAITPAVVNQLDGTDQYLGLFARNNHHGDALQFASGVIVPTSDGTETYNVGDAIKRLGDIPTGTGLSETKAREIAQEIVNNSPAIQANTAKTGISTTQAANIVTNNAKVGTTQTERTRIATIPTLTNAVQANTAKPTNAQVDTRADNRIAAALGTSGSIAVYVAQNAGGTTQTEKDAIAANTAKTGITNDQADDIVRNNAKISFLPEDSAKLNAVQAQANSHDTIFGTRLVGDWESGEDLVFAPGISTLNLGDLVTQDGEVFEALEAGLNAQTSASAPDSNPSAWRSYKIQTMPYDATGLTQLVTTAQNTANTALSVAGSASATANAATTPAEAKAQAVTAIGESLVDGEAIAEYVKANAGSGGGGGTLTDQQIRDAIAGSPVAAPYNYKLKFASDTVNQVAMPFLTGYNALKSFSTVGLVIDAPERTETEMVIPLVNQSVPNNVLADIPFQTMPEGTITVNTENNGALYVRGILRTTHNAGDAGNAFVVDRSTEIRTVNNGAVIFNFADFFSSVELSDAILARFPSGDTQQLKLDFVVQLFTDPALTQQRTRSQQTNAFTVQINDIGLTFLQAAPIIGVGGSGGGDSVVAEDFQAPVAEKSTVAATGQSVINVGGSSTLSITAPSFFDASSAFDVSIDVVVLAIANSTGNDNENEYIFSVGEATTGVVNIQRGVTQNVRITGIDPSDADSFNRVNVSITRPNAGSTFSRMAFENALAINPAVQEGKFYPALEGSVDGIVGESLDAKTCLVRGSASVDVNSQTERLDLALVCNPQPDATEVGELSGLLTITADAPVTFTGNLGISAGTGTAELVSGGGESVQVWRITKQTIAFNVLSLTIDANQLSGISSTSQFTMSFDGFSVHDVSATTTSLDNYLDSEGNLVRIRNAVGGMDSGGDVASGLSIEAVANEMRADGDEATIPAETLPDSAQITATAEAQTAITVPDNALFRGLSTINASFSSTIINTGNAINVGIRYTDDDTVAPTGGLRPAFTNSTIRNFTGIDLTRPIAFFFGMGEIQDITVGDLSFTNTKVGTGSLVDEMQTVILNQVASDVTIGGDPVMGGGARYRTFFRDLTSAQLGAGSTQTFALPADVSDEEVTYVTWAAMVLTASTTASNATLWGGDSGASANDRGSVSLNLQQRGAGGAHSFGIARQTHGNAVRIASITAAPSSEAVVRVSITVRQGAELKLPPA